MTENVSIKKEIKSFNKLKIKTKKIIRLFNKNKIMI